MSRSPPPPVHRRHDESGVFRIRRRRITLRRKAMKARAELTKSVAEKRGHRVEPWILIVYLALVFTGSWFIVARFN